MAVAAVIFGLTYLVIGLQRIPGLHLGRPAGALLGAVALVALGVLDFDAALRAIDLDTLLFLLGMMILLAYLELSGFFEVVERRVMGWARSARSLLLIVIGSSGLLSAVFMNDTICLMLTPVVLRVVRRLELPPLPFLIAVATAAYIGSAATIIGNPQNAFIAVRSKIGMLDFSAALWPVAVAGLLIAAALLTWYYRQTVTGAPFVIPPPRQTAPVQRWVLAASLAAGSGMVLALAAGARPSAAAMAAAGHSVTPRGARWRDWAAR